jgi:hypothetical protein
MEDRAYPTIKVLAGRREDRYNSYKEGKVFFKAKSPEAPKITIVV